MGKYGVIDLQTGKLVADTIILLGKRPKTYDKGYVKFFVSFLDDIIQDREVAGKPIRTLLYLVSSLDFNTMRVYLDTKLACEELNISRASLYNHLGVLVRKGIIEKVSRNVYKLKPYSVVKGTTHEAIINELRKKLIKGQLRMKNNDGPAKVR